MTIVAVGSGDVVVVKDDTYDTPVAAAASDYASKADEVVEDKAADRKVLASVVPIGGNSYAPVALLLHFVEKGSLG